MPCDRKSMRYGHSEGHTEVCFDHTGNLMVTCGADGDVRVWEGLDDDDPKFFTVGDKVHSVALKNNKLVTAVSNNSVQIHTFPDGEPDGILTRFSNAPNHVSFNHNGRRVAAASSDFLVKVVEVSDSSQQRTLRGHQAPVLSVTFDPLDQYVASAGCDGSVVVWNVEQQTQVISFPLLHKTNDVTNAKSLCRLSWQPGTGELLAVPVGSSVCLYQRESWQLIGSLSDDQLTQPVNVVCWSPCARLLAAGSVGGALTVWDVSGRRVVERQQHEKGFTVCGLAWHPSGAQIAYTDTEGCLGLLDGLAPPTGPHTRPQESATDYERLFDEDDGGLMDEGQSDSGKEAAVEEEEEEEVMASTSRGRKRTTLLDDDDSQGSLRFADVDDVIGAAVPAAPSVAPPGPVYNGPRPTPPQKAFQPGSTPNHLSHRFMVWNSVGVVRRYVDERDNAIDVEFHDSAVHHAMHVANTLGHTMADLSQHAVLLACPSTEQLHSKVQCLHFSSWDSCRDWVVDLPPGEEAVCVCLGEGWGAVATSSLTLRLFSVGGLQKEVISLPGPAVCLSGQGGQLMVVYHRGPGWEGDQALNVMLLHLSPTKKKVVNEALPLSPKSSLSWSGFTSEGTPVCVDSLGVVRMLARSLGGVWTPVCNTRGSCRSQSDHFWVVGVSENPQQLRCVPCKGSRYPPTLPRPAVTVLTFNLPLCQNATEKSQLEEEFWRSSLFNDHFLFLSGGGEVDEDARRQNHTHQQEVLMKLFALSCRMDREFRCVELAQMMSHSVVNLAIRYASRSRRMALAQRLSELALHNANLPQEDQSEEDDHLDNAQHSGDNVMEVRDDDVITEGQDGDDKETHSRQRVNPFSKDEGSSVCPSLLSSVSSVGIVGRTNPFKVGVAKASPSQPRAAKILDSLSSRKSSLIGSTAKAKQIPELRPLPPRAKTKTQSTLLQVSSLKTNNQKNKNREPAAKATPTEAPPTEAPPTEAPPPSSAAENTENQRPQTGFQLWMEENKNNILKEQPDLDHGHLIKEAMSRYRTLSATDRLTWTQRARGPHGNPNDGEVTKGSTGPHGNEEEEDGERKRKRVEDEERSSNKKKSQDSSSRLSAFTFTPKPPPQ